MAQTVQGDQDPLQGIIVAAITPRRPGDMSIDLGATLELVDFLGSSGVNGIALLGSTGEFVHFSLNDRRHMTAMVAKRCGMPLLVNVSHTTLDGAVELACEAADSYVAGVLLMPPYYFRYSQEAICQFFLDFSRQVPGDLPVYLYNIPMFTCELGMDTTLELLETGRFAGIKDSGGSWDHFMRMREHRISTRHYSILIGQDHLFARARALGAQGTVSGVAAAVPELMVAIEAAVTAGDDERVNALQARLEEFIAQIAQFPAPMGIKEAVRARCIKAGSLAAPLGASEKEKLERFVDWFPPWLAEVRKECSLKTGRHRGR